MSPAFCKWHALNGKACADVMCMMPSSFTPGVPQCSQAAGREAPWAVVGVLSEKLPIRAASTGKPYSLWVLSDLNGAPMAPSWSMVHADRPARQLDDPQHCKPEC